MKNLIQLAPTVVGYTIATSSGAGLAVGVCHLCHPKILTDEEKIEEALKKKEKEWDDKAREGKRALEEHFENMLMEEARKEAERLVVEDRKAKIKINTVLVANYKKCVIDYIAKNTGLFTGWKTPSEKDCKVDLQ